MGIGKKELKLIGVFAVLIYALIFYKFVLEPVIPSVTELNGKIDIARKEKALLDDNYKNINVLKSELTARNTSNERIDEYLMSSANMVDSLDYVDKLTRLIGSNVADLNIAKPQERVATLVDNPIKSETDLASENSSGTRYYEIKMNFTAYMSYASALELVNYVEGGTRRVKITEFTVKPLADNKIPGAAANAPVPTPTPTQTPPNNGAKAGVKTAVQTLATTPPANPEKLFEIKMTVSLYALSLRASDRVYEYSRHKMNQFNSNNGIIFTPASTVKTSSGTGSNGLTELSEYYGREDIIIRERSYLAAGENLQIFGIDRENDILRVKTNKPASVNIRFSKDSYTLNTVNEVNKVLQITGELPDKDLLTVFIGVDLPLIKENKNIRLNVNIANNSGKVINVALSDRQQRVSVLDRYGNQIYGDNLAEKVNII